MPVDTRFRGGQLEEVLHGGEAIRGQAQFRFCGAPAIDVGNRRQWRKPMKDESGVDELDIEALPKPSDPRISRGEVVIDGFQQCLIVDGVLNRST